MASCEEHDLRRYQFDLNLYSGYELDEALRIAGFSAAQLFGSFAGTPFDGTASRLVAVARR
jgi:hypothetical protein